MSSGSKIISTECDGIKVLSLGTYSTLHLALSYIANNRWWRRALHVSVEDIGGIHAQAGD